MSKISVYIEDWVDIDLEEIDTDDLINELIERKKDTDIDSDIFIPSFKTTQEQLFFIKRALGLKDWHEKERVLQELESLYKF